MANQSILFRDGKPVALDRLQAQLYALAADEDTFSADPASSADQREAEVFADFSIDLDKRAGEIADLTRQSADIRKYYTDLVPDKVTHRQVILRLNSGYQSMVWL